MKSIKSGFRQLCRSIERPLQRYGEAAVHKNRYGLSAAGGSANGGKFLCIYLIGLLWLWGSLTAGAATWYVTTNGNDATHNGTGGWDQAYATISNAVSASANQETILVSNGLYAITAAIAITKNITVRSVDDNPTNTIVDAGYLDRCFTMASVTNATLSGFTIQHGTNSSSYGGGVYFNATGTVQNCIFSGNIASNCGGGLYIYDGIVSNCLFYENTTMGNRGVSYGGGGLYARRYSQIADCVIRNNETSSDGGGAYIRDYVQIINCTIVSNKTTDSASRGGGVLLYSITTLITNCTVSFNTGRYGGGATVSDTGGGTIINSRFLCNTGTYGGGVYFSKPSTVNQGSTLLDCDLIGNSASLGGGVGYANYTTNNQIQRCRVQDNRTTGNGGGLYCYSTRSNVLEQLVITGNSSGADGGGIYLTGSSNLIRNCLIAMNTANTNYGGVYFECTASEMENCTIVSNVAANDVGGLHCRNLNDSCVLNTIIYHNTDAGDYPNWRRLLSDVTFSNNCTTPSVGAYGTGNTTNDPALVSLSAGNYRLARGSPCINTGLNQPWMTGATDLDGYHRIGQFDSGPVDMGCYEYLNAGTFFIGR